MCLPCLLPRLLRLDFGLKQTFVFISVSIMCIKLQAVLSACVMQLLYIKNTGILISVFIFEIYVQQSSNRSGQWSLYRHISSFLHNVPFPSPQRPRILVQVSLMHCITGGVTVEL